MTRGILDLSSLIKMLSRGPHAMLKKKGEDVHKRYNYKNHKTKKMIYEIYIVYHSTALQVVASPSPLSIRKEKIKIRHKCINNPNLIIFYVINHLDKT